MRKDTLTAALAVALLVSFAASAQDAKKEIEKYQRMLAEDNPAELWEMQGEAIWKKPAGPNKASLERCDLGLGPGVVKGAYAQMPRYFKDTDRVQDLESRLVTCITTLQGYSVADATKRVYGTADRPSDMEYLASFVAGQSKGVKLAVSTKHPKEKEAYDLGKKLFFYRAGTWDFSCASCHGEDNKRIRMQDLPNLTKAAGARVAYTTWPAYRVSQSAVRTMQWRLWDCFRQQRFPELQFGSDTSVALTSYMAVTANGAVYRGPGIKR